MQVVPYEEGFEKALIIGVLSDTSLIPRVSSIVDENDFFKEYHKEIFRAIKELGPDADSLTVENKLSEETKSYFKELVKESDSVLPSLTNILVYAEVIHDKSRLRAGIDLGREIVSICFQPNADAQEALRTLEDMFADFLQKRVIEDKTESTVEAFSEYLENLGKNVDKDGIKSGFEAIDMFLHSLEGLIVLAGRPSTGKTALAINIARNVAESKPVLFFSLEQTRDSIFERMLASEAEVNSEEIRTGAYLGDDYSMVAIGHAIKKLTPILKNIHIDDRPNVDTTYITSVSRQKQFELGEIGLIIIDYLHIMKLDGKHNKVDALGDATKEIRALGKELGCPIILLSQLSRQSDQSPSLTEERSHKRHRRPELTDLRSSGEIEQSADVVLFLYRESYYDQISPPPEDIVEVIVRKNRNGRIGFGMLGWIPRFVKFKNI